VGDDRAEVRSTPRGLLLVVADGAGGSSGGAHAADSVVDRVIRAASMSTELLESADFWLDFLRDADRQTHTEGGAGETTAVVIHISTAGIVGASVGDSEAWLIHETGFDDLTGQQRRKPLIGSARALPIGFRRAHFSGRLVVGSDGLFNYGPSDAIAECARRSPIERVAEVLVELVRLPSGALVDDVAVLTCEPART
jgi:serine/threonine protein phosphatase PrpC